MKRFFLTLLIKDEDTGKEASTEFTILDTPDRDDTINRLATAITKLLIKADNEIREDN